MPPQRKNKGNIKVMFRFAVLTQTLSLIHLNLSVTLQGPGSVMYSDPRGIFIPIFFKVCTNLGVVFLR